MQLHPNQEQKRLLCVLAHPDDEVFCAGGTLAQAAAQGIETMVVSATRGEAGQIRDGRIATRWTLGEIREAELYQSTQQLGVHHTVCLDYGDGTLADVAPRVLIKTITGIIRQFQPDTVITFGPDGAYGHPDHVAIGAATTEAVKVAGDAWQYPEQIAAGLRPFAPARLYYSFFPRKQQLLLEQLAHWLVEQNGRFQGTSNFAQATMLLAKEATMLGYVSDHVETSWFPVGFNIIEQDEPADQLYLILSGEVSVQRQAEGGNWQTLSTIGPGSFFGEEGLAYQRPRNAHVVAASDVTCLVFSPQAPSNFAGRGEGAQLANTSTSNSTQFAQPDEVLSFDVSNYVLQKVAAMGAHRTQFSFDPDMLPLSILRDLFGQEYFVPVQLKDHLEKRFSATAVKHWRQFQPENIALYQN